MDCLPGLVCSVYPNKMFLLFNLWRSFVEHRLFSDPTIFAIHVLVLTIKVEICLDHHTSCFLFISAFCPTTWNPKCDFYCPCDFDLFLWVDLPISIWVCWMFLKYLWLFFHKDIQLFCDLAIWYFHDSFIGPLHSSEI